MFVRKLVMKILGYILVFLSIFNSVFSQKTNYSIENIADSLKQNANSIVRLNQVDVVVSSQRNMSINTNRQVTIINENGLAAINAYEYYDNKTKVKSIEAIIYDAKGMETKKIKKKDFRDQSINSEGTMISDSRVIFINYTPTNYPFTIVYSSEVETSNTALIKPFVPINNLNSSIEKSVFNIICPENLGFKFKECNFSNFPIAKSKSSAIQLSYVATNIVAQKEEELSLNFRDLYPIVYFSLENFNLEGVDGSAKNWQEYGQWFSKNILEGTTELSEETKSKIKSLVGLETDLVKKAKIVYQYVQDKTRYVGIQVGLGGFKPTKASEVDRLGYSDCKGLSNYTRALLDVVGVTSFYTELFAGNDKIDLQKDFFSTQGNHAMLCIPNKDKNIFLECTSQDNPFGFQSVFSDDRDVVIIKPDGAEIVRTTIYVNKTNSQISKGKFSISDNGSFSGNVSIITNGSQYARSAVLQKKSPTENEKHYKEYLNNIENLHIEKINFTNNKDLVEFTENITVSSENYGRIIDNKMIFSVNAYNQYNKHFRKIRSRKTAFEIDRGFFDQDEISIDLPMNFQLESLPADFELNSKFGEYKTEIIKKSDGNLIYKRSFFIKKGIYKKSEFEEYRLYLEEISRNDNAKIILSKNK